MVSCLNFIQRKKSERFHRFSTLKNDFVNQNFEIFEEIVDNLGRSNYDLIQWKKYVNHVIPCFFSNFNEPQQKQHAVNSNLINLKYLTCQIHQAQFCFFSLFVTVILEWHSSNCHSENCVRSWWVLVGSCWANWSSF